MNFVTEFLKGQKGTNKGLWMGEGLESIYKAINGIQRRKYFVIASAPKVGKSSFVNYGFLYSPYLYALENKLDVRWIYYSLEMSRVDLEFDTACFFLNYDYGINIIFLPKGITKDGKNFITLSPSFLKGEEIDDNGKIILLSKDLSKQLQEVYIKRLIPLFGEYNAEGNKLHEGLCEVIEIADNPTGIYYHILDYAAKRGRLKYSEHEKQRRLIGYKPYNEKEYIIVIFDHCRKSILERGYNEKQNIEKLSSYFIEIRNKLNYIPVNIVHLNRSLSDLDRFKQFGKFLFPDSDMVKSSGSLGEDCSYLFTLFNPNDERYNLKEHFDLTLRDQGNNTLHPNLRTIHLVESRHTYYPQHFRTELEGNLKRFSKFKK